MSAPVERPSPAPAALWLIVAAALCLELLLLARMGDIEPILDEVDYVFAGESVARGEGIRYRSRLWDEVYQPPLYALFLGAVFRSGGGPVASKVAQALLAALSTWFVFLLGKRWSGQRAGLVAAGLFAFYPTLVAFTHYNYSETLFLFWLLLAFLLLFGPGGEPARPGGMLLAGLALGLAALTRAVVAYLAPALVLWILLATRDLRATALRGGPLLIGFALAILPWQVELQRRYGGFLLICSQPAKIWHRSYNALPPRTVDYGMFEKLELPDDFRPRVQDPDPVARTREETRRGLEFLRRNPLLCLERFGQRVGFLFNPTSYLIRHLRWGRYDVPRSREPSAGSSPSRELLYDGPEESDAAPAGPPRSGPLVELLVALTVASYLFVSIAGLLGLWALRSPSAQWFAAGTIVFFVAMYGLTYATSRYRLSFVPLLMLGAGHALADPRAALRRVATPVRAGSLLLVLALHVWLWSLHWDRIWS